MSGNEPKMAMGASRGCCACVGILALSAETELIASGLLLIALILLVAYAESHRKVEVLFTAQPVRRQLQVFHDGRAGSRKLHRKVRLAGGKPVEGV